MAGQLRNRVGIRFHRLRGNDAPTRLRIKFGSLWLRRLPMFGLEVCKILHVFLVRIGLAIRRQLDIVPLFGGACLSLEWFFACRIQLLPPVADKLGYLCEGEVLIFHLFTHSVGKDYIGGRRAFGRVLVGLGMTPILSFCLGSWSRAPFSGRRRRYITLNNPSTFWESFLSRRPYEAFIRDASIFSDCALEFLVEVSANLLSQAQVTNSPYDDQA